MIRRIHRPCGVLIARREFSAATTSFWNPSEGTLGFTSEQMGHYKSAKNFADRNFKPFALEWDTNSEFPREALRQCGAAGYGGLGVSQRYGGQGMSRQNMCAVIEALASCCVSTTAYLTIHNGILGMIDKFGNEGVKSRFLPKLTTMEQIASFCLTEPGSGSDAASIQTQGYLDTNTQEYVINGQKCFISGAGSSDVLLTMFRTPASTISCAIVPKDTPGISFGSNEKKMGWKTQPTRQVHFENVRVPAANLVGVDGQGFKVAMVGLDGARLSVAACSLGAASDALRIALQYVAENKLQGQGVQFKLAGLCEQLQSARLILLQAARLVDEQAPTAIQQCALAKKICTDHGSAVCAEVMEIMSYEGLLHKNRVEKHWRDLRVHQILEGTNEIMRFIVGRAIVS